MRNITRICFIAIICALAAEPLRADPVDDYVESKLKEYEIPGISLAVVRDGKVLKAKGYGLADVELNVPATERTMYQWASVTKQFTATAILLLVEEGKLGLNDSISRYYAKAPAAWTNVTVRHLLHHTSGIKSYTSLPDFRKTLRKDFTPDELLGMVIDKPLDFSPGERWDYNNTGYFLLGLIIENASGKTYGDFLAERIFRPLRMDTARVNHQFELIPNRATGYETRSNRTWRAEFVSPTQPYSAGALMGTVLDLAKWDAALYQDSPISSSMREEMWTPVKLTSGKSAPYGYGWQLGELRGHRYVGHGGGINGFSTYILRYREDKLTVIVLANSGNGRAETIAQGVAGRYVSGLLLSSLTPQTDADPELSERLKKCLFELSEKKDSEILTPQFRRNYANSQRRFAALQKDLKDLKSFTYFVNEKPSDQQNEAFGAPVARLASYRVVTGSGTRYYTFYLTDDGKVASYESTED